jgi:hypothetical protein
MDSIVQDFETVAGILAYRETMMGQLTAFSALFNTYSPKLHREVAKTGLTLDWTVQSSAPVETQGLRQLLSIPISGRQQSSDFSDCQSRLHPTTSSLIEYASTCIATAPEFVSPT